MPHREKNIKNTHPDSSDVRILYRGEQGQNGMRCTLLSFFDGKQF